VQRYLSSLQTLVTSRHEQEPRGDKGWTHEQIYIADGELRSAVVVDHVAVIEHDPPGGRERHGTRRTASQRLTGNTFLSLRCGRTERRKLSPSARSRAFVLDRPGLPGRCRVQRGRAVP